MRFEFSGNPVRYGCIMAGSGLPVRPTWHPLRQFALLRGRGGRRGLHRIGLATNEREHRRQILGLDEHLTGLRAFGRADNATPVLLTLPISSKSGEATPYINALFTSTTSDTMQQERVSLDKVAD